MPNDDTVVKLEGVNGEVLTLAGPNAGDRGMWLGTGVKGLYDPPVKVVYEEPGNFPGARFLNYRVLRRDITLAILITNDDNDPWAGKDAALKAALKFDEDAFLHVTTPESGTRTLKVRLGDAIDVDFDTDPNMGTVIVAKLLLIAGDPFWYAGDVVYSATTTRDTRFDPQLWTPPWPWEELPKETLTINVHPTDGKGGLNPTDQDIYLKWLVPGSQSPPPEFGWPFPAGVAIPWEKAPFTQWSLPDYSFKNDDQANRTVTTPGLIIGEDSVIDTDPSKEMIASASGSQVWARTNGVRFLNKVPAYTKSATFTVIASGVAPGQVVTLRIPRPWSRPWGLES